MTGSGGHALVVGGTGMLRRVSLWLATTGDRVSVLARSHSRLSLLASEADAVGGEIHPLPVDWHDTQALALALRAAVTARGTVSRAVCWVHSDASEALPTIMDVMADRRDPPRLFHVAGSESADPMSMSVAPIVPDQGVLYRRVVLGFVLDGAGSRWLTDEEISAGVIDAVMHDRADSVVGVVRPWDRRPS